jgi:hypothetical protein
LKKIKIKISKKLDLISRFFVKIEFKNSKSRTLQKSKKEKPKEKSRKKNDRFLIRGIPIPYPQLPNALSTVMPPSPAAAAPDFLICRHVAAGVVYRI